MKNLIFLSLIFLVFILQYSMIAQSDYEMVQSYKDRHLSITRGIEAADSLGDLNNLLAEVDKLRRDFADKKEILDQSLYPDNFESSLEKLTSAIELRKKDFAEIVELETEVGTLKSEIDAINKKNNSLINQINVLESQRKKDAATIAKLEKLVSNLRATILQRDELIYGIVDSLIPRLPGNVSELSQQEKEKVFSEVEKTNVLSVIKKSLKDNSRLLQVTTLNSHDLDEVKEQQQEFTAMWQKIGPKLVDVYQDQKNRQAELNEVDFLFNEWEKYIRHEAWESIKEEFALYSINLKRFANGKEFSEVVSEFIEDEIKNNGIKNKDESEMIYLQFTDSVWFKSVSPDWIPYLIDNNMMDTEQKNLIEGKIAKWKAIVAPSNLAWLYIVIVVVLINAAVYLIVKRRKKNKIKTTDVSGEV
ncbi:MAG: hypothetical protein IPM56_00410 [Ignavibacteriales bacterium]|nr:MAG: hypothetical protein IPM56_00410 [Ignavibacteriales bacterium]